MNDDAAVGPPDPARRVRADMLERADRVWRARVAGATWEQAAEHGGFTDASNAVRCVRRVFARLPEVEREDQRQLWRARLEHLWRQALADALEQRPGAITSGVRVATAAAALDGLNAPDKIELTTPTAVELQNFVTAVMAANRPQLEEDDILDADVVEDVVEDET